MKIRTISSFNELLALESIWDELSRDIPFRSFAWLSTWWECYGDRTSGRHSSELLVVTVTDEAKNEIVAIAPWYLDRSSSQGRVIRWLGSGEVCSDYLSVLCKQDCEAAVATALGDWLLSDTAPDFDAIQLSGVSDDDTLLHQLIEKLTHSEITGPAKAAAHRRNGPTCWRLSLPGGWDEYLKLLSKTRRKRARGIVRDWFEAGRAELVTLSNADDLPEWMITFEDLHQRRRRSLGQPGCFASAPFARFLNEVTPKMFASGKFQFNQLRIDGQPVAMDFNLLGNDTVFAYQGGVDPDSLDHQPGHLITISQIRRALDHGIVTYDFLQGDEPYKHNWRAAPTEYVDYRIVPNRTRAKLTHALWATKQQARSWARSAYHVASDVRERTIAAFKGMSRERGPA